MMGEWLLGQWIVGVISFQELYGLYGLKHHSGEKVGSHGQTDTRKCEDRGRIHETRFAIASV